MDSKRKPAATKVKPRVALTCGSCGKPYGNPLTHVCRTGTDFKKRKRAAEKAAKPKPQARTGTAHEYTTCDDDDCSKYPCRVYKEGLANGEVLGRQIGYAEGFPDGISACPRPHQG